MDLLTSRSARVRDARALTVGKHRRQRGEFLAEGPQAVREALAAGAAVAVFVQHDSPARASAEVARAHQLGIPVHLVDAGGFAGLVGTETPQGVVARCRWLPPVLADVLAEPGPGQLVLAHEMADPGNAGALIRVADAAGARAVALSERSVDPTNPKCVRATAGSLFHVPVLAVGSTTGALRELRQAGYRLLATALAAESLDLFDAEDRGLLEGRVAWIFGNEAHGLPAEVLADCDHIIRIPILGRAESLNLATAGAVSLYAVARAARRGR